MELAIDTSTRYASVALSREGQVVAELSWRSERNHSIELVPAIKALMDRSPIAAHQLRAIFVARGPGGFSALRVGISTAKTMASSLKIPMVSVPTLDVEAEPYLKLGERIWAVIEAGRNRVYLGRYGAANADGQPDYAVVDHGTLASMARGSILLCGEGVPSVADMVRERLSSGAKVVELPSPTRRPSILAHLGYRRWQAGQTDDPATLQPLYLRTSQVDMANRTWAKA